MIIVTNCPKWLQGIKVVLLAMLLTSVGAVAHAQTYIDVDPDNYPEETGNLNRAVEEHEGDDVVFRLQRGEVYWTDATIISEDYDLVIVAEEGDGHPPVIRPAVDLNFDSFHSVHGENDLTLRGIYYGGLSDQGERSNEIRLRNEGTTAVIDNIYFDWDACMMLRANADWTNWYITNSQFRNMGQKTNPSCGRAFGGRGNNIDTLVFRNNTMYMGTHFPARVFGGIINYYEFTHNTLVDWGYHMELGLPKELKMTNNLFMNIGFRGNSGRDGVGYADHSILTFMNADEIDAFDDADRNLVITNNNIGSMRVDYAQVLQDHWDAHWEAEGDSVAFTEEPAGRPFIHDQLMDSTGWQLEEMGVLTFEDNFTEEETELQFTDRSNAQNVVDYMTAFLEDPGQDLPALWDREEDWTGGADPYSGAINVDRWRDWSYSTDAISFTAGENGFPLGDLNWFPEYKEAWEAGDPPPTETSVEDVDEIAGDFRLLGNYPNPFNPTTTIRYQLSSSVEVTMEIYNSLGQQVDIINIGRQSAGTHEINYDATNLSSGIYMVRMQVGNEVQTAKITLVK